MAEKAKTTKTSSKNVSTKTTPPVATPENKVNDKMQISNSAKIFVLIIVVFTLIALLGYLAKNYLVAATVNGKPITRFAVIKVIEKQSGSMALENLITKELITQEVKKRNIVITQADIDKELKSISENLKKQGTTLEKALEMQGMTKKQLNDELKIQLAIQRMVESEIKVDDKEIDEFITTNSDQFPEGTTDTQMRELAMTQLKQQKSQEKTQALIESIQKKAKIIQFAQY